jgi:hypothetical protein
MIATAIINWNAKKEKETLEMARMTLKVIESHCMIIWAFVPFAACCSDEQYCYF